MMTGRKSSPAQDKFNLLIGADLVVEEPLGSKPGEDVVVTHHLFQSKGPNLMKLDDNETSRKDMIFVFFTLSSMENESIPRPPWFPLTVLFFCPMVYKLVSFQCSPSAPPKVLSSTLGTDHPLLLVAKPGEFRRFPPGRMDCEWNSSFLLGMFWRQLGEVAGSLILFFWPVLVSLFVFCWH